MHCPRFFVSLQQVMKKRSVLILLSCLAVLASAAQPQCRIDRYDEENGLPHGHVTQLLQDANGFLWFATWNGLARFDGYDFRTFKPVAGDGCHMSSDRIRDIALRPDGEMVCRVDSSYYLFNTQTYRFRDISSAETPQAVSDMKTYRQSKSLAGNGKLQWTDAFGTCWTLDGQGRLTSQQADDIAPTAYPLPVSLHVRNFALPDAQGNLWILSNDCILKLTTYLQYTQPLLQEQKAQVKCLFTDRKGRLWVTTREDATVRLLSADGRRTLGYLSADGRLTPTYTRFRAPVYCMFQSADGTLWLGSKPDGLFRLVETADGRFDIDHLTNLPNTNIYGVTQDADGRLWVATLGGGICYTTEIHSPQPHFITPQGYPKGAAQCVRYLHITPGRLLVAASTEGLVVAKIEKNVENMRFHRHQREADQAESLSSSATMDVLNVGSDKLAVSTESGGVNYVSTADLLSEQPRFRHFNTATHQLPNDVILSLTPLKDGQLMAVSSTLVTIIDTTGHTRVLDARFFNHNYRFSDAHPQQLSDGSWIFGLQDGACSVPSSLLHRRTSAPKLVLTGVAVQGSQSNWAAESLDSLTLLPSQRSLTIHFAALDYSYPERISYAFQLRNQSQISPISSESDSTQWHYIGNNRSATLLDLEPGIYVLNLRSTNADGEWQQPARSLVIIVQPTFWESIWGKLLILFLAIAILAAVARTYLYIKHIKRKQRETLEAYLALTSQKPTISPVHAPSTPASDPMLQRVMAFIDQRLSDSDIGVGDMAAAAATSRSGLQRKLKLSMGITPQDLLREARIKRACQLLQTTDKTIADVAYSCGFTDPKYFSRCFKQSTGRTPSEYKNASM